MKKLFTFSLIIYSLVCFAQNQGDVVIEWLPTSKLSYGTFELNVPQFKSSAFHYDYVTKQISYNLNIESNFFADENSIVLSNLVYEPITLLELGEVDVNKIPSTLTPMLKNSEARDLIYTQITFSPILKIGNSYNKIISFSYQFNSSVSNNSKFSALTSTSLTNSVLSSGSWYRFYIQTSGVYSLSKSFLESLGVSLSGVDPKKIKIYGNGGRMLPLVNSITYPNDIEENAIQVIGENDGSFDSGDQVLFYGEGVDTWNSESNTNGNLYSDRSYYYVNVEGNFGKRIPVALQPSGPSTTSITTFDDSQYHEIDLTNIGKLGRQWFGEKFDVNNVQTFNFDFPNFVPGLQINTTIALAAIGINATNFGITYNSANAGTISLSASSYPGNIFQIGGLNYSAPATQGASITLTYNNNGVPSSVGYLDYINIKAKRFLKGYGNQFRFQYDLSNSTIGVGSYEFTNSSAISQVWDVTDIYNVEKYDNPASTTFSFKANMGSIRKYVAIDYSNLYTPLKDANSQVSNQDLKGTIFKDAQGNFLDVDYLIIAPNVFRNQAEKLANFHRNYSGLNVKVVNLDPIYIEFGSGKQDIGAIRNFVKYVYENASTPSKRIKYLNLFGDASYDFKDRVSIKTNFVPIYHALNSQTIGESSFASDDFFGLMSANEGYMDTTGAGGDGLDIAVGRMIANSPQQADDLVNKVIDYHDIKSYGNWRNNVVFVADDPSASETGDSQLQYYQNIVADKVMLQKPFMNVKKILLDSYVQESTAGGFRYPKAREDFFNAFARGALVVNYLGHGGEDGLTQERVWEKIDGQSLSNRYKYPLFVTLTCDFSRFDNPFRKTAGEYACWNATGGAISMITTVREIGQTTAQNFNDPFVEKLFSYGSNQYTSIAEALRLAKNATSGNENVVFYLGDPALKLAVPEQKLVLTKVNNLPISGPIPDLKSLDFVTLSGEVQDENNIPITNYNGDLIVNIFDKNIPRVTLRNDGADAYPTGATMPFITLGETIFRGNASVTNGKFEFGFVVPRDIRIPLGNGRVSLYAKRNQILLDKTGYNTDIKIGGVNLTAAIDVTPPKVRIYMNDETFVTGGITNESPFFLAFMDDENGMNTASGIGHDMVAILDGNVVTPYILNDYYETELNNYKKGKLKYQFKKLSIGLHTLTFKAWDVYNNLVTSEIQFIVVGDETLTLSNVLNYPNPFVNYTQFWFSHNRPFEQLDVQIQVMTISGKVVWTKNENIQTNGFLSREISWDGKDDFGDRLAKGVYIYKLTVRSPLTDTTSEKYEKLVIL
jgi:Peptidase family C25